MAKFRSLALLSLAFAGAAHGQNDWPGLSGTASATTGQNRFTIAGACEFQCLNAREIKKADFEAGYSPEDQGLRRGNGNFFSMLGIELWTWGENACLAQATSSCGGEEKVASFNLQKLQSGTWSMAGAPKCAAPGAPAEQVMSPYDKSQTLNQTAPASGKAAAGLTQASTSVPMLSHAHIQGDKQKCDNLITSQTCFGDCMVDQGKSGFCQTLCSRDGATRGNINVCGDAMLQEWLNKGFENRSIDQLRLSCDRYFYNSARYAPNGNLEMTTACAAFRATTNCQAIAAKFKSPPAASARPATQPSALPSTRPSTGDHSLDLPGEKPKCCRAPKN